MEQNLPDIIEGNKDLQQALLKQEGGIVSYLAGHLDADGLDALYEGYRAQCLKKYRDKHKWSMGEDMIKRGALDDDHIKNELAYQMALTPVLSRFPDVVELCRSFIADYMDYAFKEYHKELYLNVVPDQTFYEDVIIQYSNKMFGMAHRCLWLVINEYRGKARAEKDADQLWEEFRLWKYAQAYIVGMERLQKAVDELINEKTRGMNKDECRQICRNEAIDLMKSLKPFTRLVNGDDDILELPLKEDPSIYEIWSSKDLERIGVNMSFIAKQKKYISKEEKSWLRFGMLYGKGEMTRLQDCFRRYYYILERIGDEWASKLWKYDIDIRELEKETGCILNENGLYWIRSSGGRHFKSIPPSSLVEEHARMPLSKIKHVDPISTETLTEEKEQGTEAHKTQAGTTDHKEFVPTSNSEETYSHTTPPGNKKPRPRGRPPKKFEDFIYKEAPEELMPVLEKMMKETTGRETITIILSIVGVYMDMPTISSISKRFDTVGETTLGEALAQYKGRPYGKKDYTKNPKPITEEELKSKRNKIKTEIADFGKKKA